MINFINCREILIFHHYYWNDLCVTREEIVLTPTILQNVGESRIPVPRAARPSFFPKSRVLEASRLLSGSRRSTIFSGCFQFVNTEDESPTPREKFSGFTTSSPNIKGNCAREFVFIIITIICMLSLDVANMYETNSMFQPIQRQIRHSRYRRDGTSTRMMCNSWCISVRKKVACSGINKTFLNKYIYVYIVAFINCFILHIFSIL